MSGKNESNARTVLVIVLLIGIAFALLWTFGPLDRFVVDDDNLVSGGKDGTIDNDMVEENLIPDENLTSGDNKVLFRYEAEFTYLGSEENKPLWMYGIRFPCPTVENKPVWDVPDISSKKLSWQLWGRSDNGDLVLEVDDDNVLRAVGPRKKFGFPEYDKMAGRPFVTPSWKTWYNANWKIMVSNDYDNIYPGEVLHVAGRFALDSEKLSALTLTEKGDGILADPSWYNSEWALEITRERGEPPSYIEKFTDNDVVSKIDLCFNVDLFRMFDGKGWELLENYKEIRKDWPQSGVGWLDLS